MSVMVRIAKTWKQCEVLNDWTVLEQYNREAKRSEFELVVEL